MPFSRRSELLNIFYLFPGCLRPETFLLSYVKGGKIKYWGTGVFSMIRMRKFVSQLTALGLTLPASFAAPATAHANQKPCDDVVVLEHQISKKTLHALQMPVKGSGDHMLAPSQVCKHLVLKRDNLMR